ARLRYQAGEAHISAHWLDAERLAYNSHLRSIADQHEMNLVVFDPAEIFRHQFLDAPGEKIDAVPLTECSDEADDDGIGGSILFSSDLLPGPLLETGRIEEGRGGTNRINKNKTIRKSPLTPGAGHQARHRHTYISPPPCQPFP